MDLGTSRESVEACQVKRVDSSVVANRGMVASGAAVKSVERYDSYCGSLLLASLDGGLMLPSRWEKANQIYVTETHKRTTTNQNDIFFDGSPFLPAHYRGCPTASTPSGNTTYFPTTNLTFECVEGVKAPVLTAV
jgi:hypothetical protein